MDEHRWRRQIWNLHPRSRKLEPFFLLLYSTSKFSLCLARSSPGSSLFWGFASLMSVRTLCHRSSKGPHREHASRRTPGTGQRARAVLMPPARLPARHATLFDRLQGHARCLQNLTPDQPARICWLAGTPLDAPLCSSVMVRARLHLPPSVTSRILPYARVFLSRHRLPPGVCLKTHARVGVETSADTMVDPQPIH